MHKTSHIHTLTPGHLLMTDMFQSVVGLRKNVDMFVNHYVYSFSLNEGLLGLLVCIVMNNRTLEAYLVGFNEGLSVM